MKADLLKVAKLLGTIAAILVIVGVLWVIVEFVRILKLMG